MKDNSKTRLNHDEIKSTVSQYAGKKVKLAVADMDGILRGKIIHLDKFTSAVDSNPGFCSVVFGWDIGDQCLDDLKFTGWHNGYPDTPIKIDLDTFRQIPWDDNIPFFLADFENEDGKGLEICPRTLLKKVRSHSRSLGFEPTFSQEFEWFNFKEQPDELYKKDFIDPTPLTPGMFGYSLHRASQNKDFFNALFDNLRKVNIPLEGLHTETGPGVYEAAITYSDILEAADRACCRSF
jgi:glutamine synthetase